MLDVLFEKGGPMTGPLLLCSLIAITVVVERIIFWFQSKSNTDLKVRVEAIELVASKEYETLLKMSKKSDDPALKIAQAGVEDRGSDPVMSMELTARESSATMNSRLGLLETLVAVAPLLGILGTVLGIIDSFGFLGNQGLKDPEAITGGISEALFSTAGGLVVAIISLVFLNIFKNLTKKSVGALEVFIGKVSVALKKGGV